MEHYSIGHPRKNGAFKHKQCVLWSTWILEFFLNWLYSSLNSFVFSFLKLCSWEKCRFFCSFGFWGWRKLTNLKSIYSTDWKRKEIEPDLVSLPNDNKLSAPNALYTEVEEMSMAEGVCCHYSTTVLFLLFKAFVVPLTEQKSQGPRVVPSIRELWNWPAWVRQQATKVMPVFVTYKVKS